MLLKLKFKNTLMNKNILFLCYISLQLISCNGVKKTTKSKKNSGDEFAKTITQKDLKTHLSILASDEYEGRETAMPGQKKAAKYIANYFEKIGLQKGYYDTSYFQNFPVDVKDPTKIAITVGGKKMTFLNDFFYMGSFVDTSYTDLEVVYVNYGVIGENYSDYAGLNVKGKAVLLKEGMPKGVEVKGDWDNWRKKLKVAKDNGAVAVFTINQHFDERVNRIRSFIANPRMQLHNKGQKDKIKTLPNIFISPETAQNFFNVSVDSKKGQLTPKIQLLLEINQVLSSSNVLGYIEGTDKKEELVVITAHYDHLGYDAGEICNGADDDGSGTVAVLELAQAFIKAKKAGKGTRRSILFMTVSGEEKGLLGSEYYTENPVYKLKNTICDLNIDMIGRIDDQHLTNNYVYLIGADKISSDLHDISEKANTEKIQLELDYTFNREDDPNRFYYRSDHYNFAEKGIPVIFYFSGTHEDYHKPTDDVEKIDFEKIEKTTKLVFYTAWKIANRESRLNINEVK